MMDKKRAVAYYYIYRKYKKRVNQRKFWIHPLIEKRALLGAFATLFNELKEDGRKFFNYFRMSVSTFEKLCAKLHPLIQRQNSKMRNCISPVEMVAVSIRYVTKND